MQPVAARARASAAEALADGDHRLYWDGQWIAGPVYARERLGPGHQIAGPAVIEQEDSTTLVHPRIRAPAWIPTSTSILEREEG